jgi:antitoxin MazE
MQDDDDKEPHGIVTRNTAVTQRFSLDELIKGLRAFRGRLPRDFKFDRDEANSR